jgi:tricorn protease
MIKPIQFVLISLIVFTFSAVQASDARLLRFPAVHNSQVVFTYAGDLYSVPLSGGVAKRLTSHVGFEMFPRFSPDGSTIAFTGQYDGNTEVYTIPAQGGKPKRITHTATLSRDDVSDRMGPNNIVMGWTPDGASIVYRSRGHSFNSFNGRLYLAPASGGPSAQLPLSTAGFNSYSPDGSKLAFNRVFREFRTWKYYAGGMADDVWIFDFETKKTVNVSSSNSQDIIPMWIGDEIFYISDRNRTMNLFSYNTSTGQTQQVTHFTDFDIKFPSHSANTIVFEKGGYLYAFNALTREVNHIPVTLTTDYSFSRSEFKDASEHVISVYVAPDGSRLLFSARGDIFTVPAKQGITRNLTQNSSAHDREAVWSHDGRQIAFISDRSGEYEIYVQDQDGSSPAIQLTSGDSTYKYALQWSPDNQRILWNDRQGKLQFIDINSKRITTVATGKYNLIFSYKWSPDGRWIAYSKENENRMSSVHLYSLDRGITIPVTDGWFRASQPSFSADGKYLLFVSDRDFNPIYSRTEWNHAYDAMSRVYMVMLSKDTPSPFAPKNDEVTIEVKPDPRQRAPQRGAREEDDKTEKPVQVIIDIDGLAQRTIALPTEVGYYWNVNMVDGKVYFMRQAAQQDHGSLYIFDLEEKKEERLAEKVSYDITADGKKMLVETKNTYNVIDLPTKPFTIDKPIDLSGMQKWVDYRQEWKQIYDESWRQMRDFFYVENMHGVDWDAMHAKYDSLIPHVNHRADLTYVIGELIGELNVGHAYVNSGDMPVPQRTSMGLLGAIVSKHTSGYFVVDSVLEGANWSQSLRSPLSDVGVNVSKGDFIIAVDGQHLSNVTDIYQTLIGKANRTVELTVNNKPQPADARRVLVVPIADESALYYYSWVQQNIRRVSQATNGRVGYIHVPNMGPDGLNEFVKHFYPQLNKQALIIDDRGNGGGNVSPMLLERLSRVPYRANMRRGFEHPTPVPNQTHIGPKVLLIDRFSASDGDLFAYGFRKLGLGPIIGTRTWGGVVGITGSLPFVDGGDLRKPEFASYCHVTGDWIIEGYGVDPDIHLDNDPYLEFMGKDEQLEKAIEVILKDLEQWKGIAPVPSGPDKSK